MDAGVDMQISNVEICGLCNLKCSYCPHPNMKNIGIMTDETFESVLRNFRLLKTKKVGLEVFGEPLMHPKVIEFVRKASQIVPKVEFYTNGTLLTREMAIQLKEAGLYGLYVSLHKPEIKENVLKAVEGLDIFKGFITKFTMNWAGKVDNKVTAFASKYRVCPYIFEQRGTIRWNGDILNCDMDSTDTNILGNINKMDVRDIKLKSFSLCKDCHYKSNNFTLFDKIYHKYILGSILKSVQIGKKVFYGTKV